MATFVLIHGAWHGGWCWGELAPRLEARGHRVVAPDLPGMGDDRTPIASVSLDSWARHVAALARTQPEPVIMVGHSRGGIVISQAAEYCTDHVAGLVYLAAFLVPDGQSMLEAGGGASPRSPQMVMVRGADGTLSLDPETAAELFYHMTPPALVERALPRLCPEPMWMFDTRLRLSPDRFGRIPRAYVEATQDRALPIERQRAMQRKMPCEMLFSLPSDHSPFYSMVEPLADALEATARAFYREGVSA